MRYSCYSVYYNVLRTKKCFFLPQNIMSGQRYIPGLMPRPEDPDKDKVPEQVYEKAEVPKDLRKAYLSGAKHAVMCVNELRQRCKLSLEFQDVGTTAAGQAMGGFACICILDGVEYPPGQARTKKDAKMLAAKNAMDGYLGITKKPKTPAGMMSLKLCGFYFAWLQVLCSSILLGLGSFVKPVLNWANVCSPNILRTVRWTMIHFLIELLVCWTWFGQSKLYFVLNWLVMRCKLRPEQHDSKKG